MIPRFLTKAVKGLAYRFGVEVRRAHPMPKSGKVPSFYDPFHEQRRMLADVAKPVLFDVGAHEGLTTLQYKELFPGARVYAFEPFEGSFQKLRAATGNVPGVHLVNQALGRTRGELKFRVNQSTATNSLLPTDPRGPGDVERDGRDRHRRRDGGAGRHSRPFPRGERRHRPDRRAQAGRTGRRDGHPPGGREVDRPGARPDPLHRDHRHADLHWPEEPRRVPGLHAGGTASSSTTCTTRCSRTPAS